MTVAVGSVTVADNGTESGTGLALAVYQSMRPALEATAPPASQIELALDPSKAAPGRRAIAVLATGIASGIAAALPSMTLTFAADDLASGVPTATRVLNGKVT